MDTRREYRRFKFSRKLDIKRLKVLLARTTREMESEPSEEAAPVRLESVLIERDATTVCISGNDVGLDTVAHALRASKGDARAAKVSRDDARRIPRIVARRRKSKKARG
jgi:hypothetical protein